MLNNIKIEKIFLGGVLFIAILIGFKDLESKVYANHCNQSCCGAGEGWCNLCDECIGPNNAPKTCSQQWCGGPPPPPPPPPCACVAPSGVAITSPTNGQLNLNPDQLTVQWQLTGNPIHWGIDRGRVPNCSNATSNDRFRIYYRKISGGVSDVPASPPPYTGIVNGWYYLDLPATTFTYNLYNLHGASTYQILVAAFNGCAEARSSTVTVITALRPTPPPPTVSNNPWLLTYGNNSHTGNFISNLPRVPISSILVDGNNNPIVKTSGESYSSTYTASTIGNQTPTRASANFFVNLLYADLNITPPLSTEETTYYDYLFNLVSSNVTLQTLTSAAFQNKTSMTAVTGKAVNQAAHVSVTGNVTIQDPTPPRLFSCNTKSVIFVSGDLTIDPDFVASSNDNGCIFVVKGKIRITNGDYKNLNNVSATALTRYDRVDALFISDGQFITYTDLVGAAPSSLRWDGLVIRGSVISSTPTFLRDLKTTFNLSQPAEAVVYDPRYVSISEFRNAFQIKDYTIREEGFDR